ncbi:hypothetical protein PG5_34980 [Pseudomonas sp. G5(2012)]|nr:hypothetical protein PG5_34980 [Pseudomonas sp. G5(2012)]
MPEKTGNRCTCCSSVTFFNELFCNGADNPRELQGFASD